MAHKNSEEEFNELVTAFFQGRMSSTPIYSPRRATRIVRRVW